MTVVSTHVSSSGRVVIPAKFRRALGIEDGDEVVISLDEGAIRISTRRQQLRRAQALVKRHVEPGRSLADELIAERRSDADSE